MLAGPNKAETLVLDFSAAPSQSPEPPLLSSDVLFPEQVLQKTAKW